jgi:hypothetical protein
VAALGDGCELLSEPANGRAPLRSWKLALQRADAIDADTMTQLSSEGERLACPLAAFVDLAQLDEPGGEIGQGGTAMLLERRVERVEGPGEGGDGISWSAELEVADAVIGLKLRLIERADPNPGSLVVFICSVECLTGLVERRQGGRSVTGDGMDLGGHGGKPALAATWRAWSMRSTASLRLPL